MKILFGAALAALMLVSCDEASEMHVVRRESIDLSGVWQSSLGECRLPGTTDENKLGKGERPTDMTTALTRLYPYVGEVTYSRIINIPAGFADKRLELIMERTKSSTLWIDGDSIGHFDHLYAPHCYRLPELTAGEHKVEIRIDNSLGSVPSGIHGSHAWTDATQTNWNGILGRFCIEASPKAIHINNVYVYPDIHKKIATVEVSVSAATDCEADFDMPCRSWNSPEPVQTLGVKSHESLKAGDNIVSLTLDMGDNPLLWSEFHPALYSLGVEVSVDGASDGFETTFGMREFATEPYIATQNQGDHVHVGDTIGSLFTINGFRTFLRGKHDACVFPLTGYAPMDVESWQKVFRIAKAYGINHYRCHSYTPPRAALLAADIEGIYFEIELPYWGFMSTEQTQLNDFMTREGRMVLDYMGNSPSFMMLGLGNELSGEYDEMHLMVDQLKAHDTRDQTRLSRHLYSFGANNNLGWRGPQDGEDCFITCRVGGYATNAPAEIPDKYSSHVRSSFSFADADDGGIINGIRPNSAINYTHAVRLCPRPVVSHETCQFQIYPDYDEIEKYTGVLYPYNYEVFRSRLEENGMTDQAKDFHRATGEWAMDCYKADIEYVLRTPGMAGYELLDLQDYPGQGSALCGVLDAFMDSKGVITEEQFCQFVAPVVPLALFRDFCMWNDKIETIPVAISNFLEESFSQPVEWTVTGEDFSLNGEIPAQEVANGEVRTVGEIVLGNSLADLKSPRQLTLSLTCGDYSNQYRFWVYVKEAISSESEGIVLAKQFDNKVKQALADGHKVVLTPRLADIVSQSVGGMLTPDYWNYAMFKSISENNNRPVSPGTLGLLFDEANPLFANFPTLGRSDWQWWSIVRNSRPLILNSLPKDYRPMVQVVDNIERNHKLGLMVDLKVGKGSLLICPTDLDAIAGTPEGAAYKTAILRYAASEDFDPKTEATQDDIETLLNVSAKSRNIQGVKNISDYKQMQ